jgi:hypothetical protein
MHTQCSVFPPCVNEKRSTRFTAKFHSSERESLPATAPGRKQAMCLYCAHAERERFPPLHRFIFSIRSSMTFAKQKTTTSTSNHPLSNRCRQFTNNTAAMLRRVWVLTVVTFWYTISTRLSQSFLLQVAPPSDPRWIQQRRGRPATGVAVAVPPLFSWRTIASCQQQQYQPTVCMASAESEEKEPEVVVQIEDLSLLQLAELMEVTFIQACMVRLLLFDDVFFVPMPKTLLLLFILFVFKCISTTAS